MEIKSIKTEHEDVKQKKKQEVLKNITQKYDVQKLFSLIFGSSNELENILDLLDIKSEKIGFIFRILSATKEKDLLNVILLFLNKTEISKQLKTYNLFLAFYSYFKGFD